MLKIMHTNHKTKNKTNVLNANKMLIIQTS